jgi:hypothetical protein
MVCALNFFYIKIVSVWLVIFYFIEYYLHLVEMFCISSHAYQQKIESLLQ